MTDPLLPPTLPPTFCSLPKWAMKEILGDSSSSDEEDEGAICSRTWECEYCTRVFTTYTETLVHERRAHLRPTSATRIARWWRRQERRNAARVLVRWARRWSLSDAWQLCEVEEESNM